MDRDLKGRGDALKRARARARGGIFEIGTGRHQAGEEGGKE